MKKITLLLFAFLASFTWQANAQVTTSENFETNGTDSTPTVLTINSGDITVNNGNPIDAISLGTFTSHYNSATGGTGWCGDWYAFDLAVTGGVADGTSIVGGCDADFNGLDVTGFTTITITSNDIDDVSDTVYFDIDLDVTYTTVTPPNCDSLLDQTVDVPLSGDISWSIATGGATGYMLVVGTGSGLDDVVNTDVGNVTSYSLGTLTAGTTYYVTITPYNGNGPATGCSEQTFVTFNPVQGDTFNDPLPITPSAEGSTCDTSAYTFSYDFSTGVSDSGTSSTCGSTSTFDMFFSWTATSDALIWNDGGSNPGVAVYDTSGNQIDCLGTYAATNAQLSGWSIGDDLIIQVYDFGTTGANPVSFCLAEFTLPDPPANDECGDAIALTVNEDLSCGEITSATVLGATDSGLTNSTCSGTENDDVWFTFVATAESHQVSISNVVGSYSDMYHVVYDGSAGCGSLGAALTCSDSNTSTTSGLTPGNTYYVQVYTYASNSYDTTFDICIGTPPPPPANDDCSGAIVITESADDSCSNAVSGTTSSATNTADYSSCSTFYNDVWYEFTPATTGIYYIERTLTSGTSSTYISLWSGTCGALTQVNSGCYSTALSESLTAGTTYLISVSTYYTGEVDFDLCVYPAPAPPANDECPDAVELTVEGEIADLPSATQIPGTILGATDSGITAPAGTANDDVWYSFVATASQINIDVTDDFDGVIQLFSGACGSLTSIEHDDYDSTYANPRISRSDFVEGETYYVRVYNYSANLTSTPDFTIALWTPAALSTQDFDKEAVFTYYPNPVNNNLTLSAQKEINNVSVYNMVGQEVFRNVPNAMTEVVDMSSLQAGAYFVKVTIGNATKTVKVIKN
ncbi:T9SS type A sorting domain-containing protein [Mesoflavibacter zeaxanthinifaciens]|uniref:T9SS type A sorting domain-containing protein n=1 Tax=Mesoflavibacter zeaxanthinifaciens TaxID=393060 RepID=UPI0004224097|nr:T9SS type A sorting domain-containing protein [Mesoflavibacter zeaxanthinifaciens]